MLFKKVFGALILILLLMVLGALIIGRQLGFSEPEPSPSPTPLESVTPTPAPTPTPTPSPSLDPYADRPNIDISSWEYTLVNKDNPLASDYAAEMSAVLDGQYFDSRAAEALKEFIAAAKAEGLTVYITSSYRSYDTQEYLFNKKVNEYISSEGSQEAAIEKPSFCTVGVQPIQNLPEFLPKNLQALQHLENILMYPVYAGFPASTSQ